jgi:hypothetical protein
LFIFVKAQPNGFPGTDAGADTASVANSFINFNDTFIRIENRDLKGT